MSRGIVRKTWLAGVGCLLGGLFACHPSSSEPSGTPSSRSTPPPSSSAPSLPSGADPIALMNQGIALLEEYRYLEAYQIFDGLARAHPDWEAAHVNKGIAALNLQNEYLKTAEESFLSALKLNPKNPHALVSLGILYHYTQKEADAYQAFEKALAVDPEDPYTLCYMGILLIEKGRVAEDRATLEKVVKLQPSFATAYWRLREVYLKLGDRPRMSQVLEEFSRLDQAKAGLKVGLKYGEGGKYNMAMRDSAPPGWKESPQGWKAPEAPLFGPPVTVALGPSVVRARPDGKPLLPAFSVGDLNGDGTLDIVLCGQAAKGASSASTAPPVTATYRRGASGDYELMEKLPADGDLGVLADIDGDGDL